MCGTSESNLKACNNEKQLTCSQQKNAFLYLMQKQLVMNRTLLIHIHKHLQSLCII